VALGFERREAQRLIPFYAGASGRSDEGASHRPFGAHSEMVLRENRKPPCVGVMKHRMRRPCVVAAECRTWPPRAATNLLSM
jgi:hypothetical protein